MTAPPLLLDTCAAVFLINGDPIAPGATEAMNAAAASGQPLHLSPVTAWEVGMMEAKGRFRSPMTPQRWFEALSALPGIAPCPLTAEILLASSTLPGRLHRDPADRILAATAREHGYMIVTRDRALLAYAAEGHIRALEC